MSTRAFIWSSLNFINIVTKRRPSKGELCDLFCLVDVVVQSFACGFRAKKSTWVALCAPSTIGALECARRQSAHSLISD